MKRESALPALGAEIPGLDGGEDGSRVREVGWVTDAQDGARVPKFFGGMKPRTSNLRAKHGVTVVSIRKAGKPQFTHADGETTLEAGDETLLMGSPVSVEAFSEA